MNMQQRTLMLLGLLSILAPIVRADDDLGDVKEKAGQVTGDPDLTNEGRTEKLAGTVQKKVGQVEKVFER